MLHPCKNEMADKTDTEFQNDKVEFFVCQGSQNIYQTLRNKRVLDWHPWGKNSEWHIAEKKVKSKSLPNTPSPRMIWMVHPKNLNTEYVYMEWFDYTLAFIRERYPAQMIPALSVSESQDMTAIRLLEVSAWLLALMDDNNSRDQWIAQRI